MNNQNQKRAREKRATQADVARLAGVSQPTVSQVLNNNTLIAVPAETRQRVLEAIDSLGYVPDRTAQSLRTRKAYTLATVIPDITNPFYPAFQRGIQDIVDQHGYDLIMFNSDGLAEKEQKYLRSLQHNRVDGVIGVFFHVKAEQLRVLVDQEIAVVRLEAMSHDTGVLPIDNVFVDHAAAARTAVEYLLAKGHTRIGMIAGQTGPRQARLRGWQQALTEHHIPVDNTLVVYSEFTEQGGYHAMHTLLTHVPRPTAIFAANDLLAIGALRALREAKLAVPNDVAVVGFDDIPAAQLVTPALTTVTQFTHRLGQRAAEMAFERLNNTAPAHGRSEEMPYELVVRETA